MRDFDAAPFVAELGVDAGAPSPARRQPVHVLYGGGHLYRAETPKKLGAIALRFMGEHLADGASLARATGMSTDLAMHVHPRVVDKLQREPIEDIRIDFEDGYGARPGDEEDAHADTAGAELARAMELGLVPEMIGLRIKSLSGRAAGRGLRTLHRFLAAVAVRTSGRLPPRFVVTLPKVERREEVSIFSRVLDELEDCLGIEHGAVGVELMVETPGALFARDGTLALEPMLDALGGRAVGAHFGTYDFTASLGVVGRHQTPQQPACDVALCLMQLACARSGVFISDGATTELPIPPHRGTESPDEMVANWHAINRAVGLHYRNVRRALERGIFQGWDLHPAQIPVRYAALHAFFLEGLDDASKRLSAFVENLTRATAVGTTFDDAATGQGLLNYFVRAVGAGALSAEDAAQRTGLTLDEIQGRSFAAIAARRM